MVRLAAAIACLLAYTFVFILIANAKASPFPDLLPSDFPSRDKWNKLGRDVIWDFLINSDIEFVDHKGHTVPPADKDATVQSPRLCGRVARLWVGAKLGLADPVCPHASQWQPKLDMRVLYITLSVTQSNLQSMCCLDVCG